MLDDFGSDVGLSLKACSNKANVLVQNHPTLLDATCWPHLSTMLDDVGLNLSLLKIFIQRRATLLASVNRLIVHT